MDRYVLHELDQLSKNVREAYDDFLFNKGNDLVTHTAIFAQPDQLVPAGLAGVTQFCTSVLSSFYFEIIKDSLYADSVSSVRRTAVVYTLQQVRRSRLARHHVD